MIGKVIGCKKDKGYCFIRDQSGNTYFCHFKNTDDGKLENGYVVDFHVVHDWRKDKPQAKNVKVISAW